MRCTSTSEKNYRPSKLPLQHMITMFHHIVVFSDMPNLTYKIKITYLKTALKQ